MCSADLFNCGLRICFVDFIHLFLCRHADMQLCCACKTLELIGFKCPASPAVAPKYMIHCRYTDTRSTPTDLGSPKDRSVVERRCCTSWRQAQTRCRGYHPSADLAVLAAFTVSFIFFRKTLSKFSASILGGPRSITLRIFALRPILRRQDKLRTRLNIT